MTYVDLIKERDDLKSEVDTLRIIMDKVIERAKKIEKENIALKSKNARMKEVGND